MVPLSTAAGTASARWIEAGSKAIADRAPAAWAEERKNCRRPGKAGDALAGCEG
jgi:hypothetical protein